VMEVWKGAVLNSWLLGYRRYQLLRYSFVHKQPSLHRACQCSRALTLGYPGRFSIRYRYICGRRHDRKCRVNILHKTESRRSFLGYRARPPPPHTRYTTDPKLYQSTMQCNGCTWKEGGGKATWVLGNL
jgi:hypothetical protein